MPDRPWPTVKLGKHAYIKARIGWRGLSSSEYTKSGVYLIAGNHIKNGKVLWEKCDFISWKRYTESWEIALRESDIIISKDGTIGRVGFIDSLPNPATINGTMMLIRVLEVFYPKYVYHYLTSGFFQKLVQDRISGSSIPHIFQRDIVELEIPKPEIVEQQRIAEILDTIDTTIQRTEALIAKLKAAKAGLLHDLLTRGLDENGQLRDPERNPELFKQTELALLPKSWKITTLGEACSSGNGSVQTGPFGSQLHAHDYKEEGVPIITVEHLGEGQILHTNLPLVGDEDYKRLQRYSLQVGDLVFSRVGAIDRCAYVSEKEDGWLFSGRCLRVRPGKAFYPRFLLYVLNSPPRQRWILNHAVGSTMPCLNTSILEAVPIALPGLDEQMRIASMLDSAASLIEAETAHVAKLHQLKRGLMEDLLTGRVRVPLAQPEAAQAEAVN